MLQDLHGADEVKLATLGVQLLGRCVSISQRTAPRGCTRRWIGYLEATFISDEWQEGISGRVEAGDSDVRGRGVYTQSVAPDSCQALQDGHDAQDCFESDRCVLFTPKTTYLGQEPPTAPDV